MDAFFLQRTLELAQRRRGFCSPNPSVGALLVNGGRIVSEGFHWAAGKPHAEIEALRGIDQETARESTLYVSLEPCCHHGKTPPCTQAILESGVREVVYAFSDPNPLVKGKGAQLLEDAGVIVRHLPLAEADAFYRSYAFWTKTGLPYTTIKLAMSLDGKTAGPQGHPLPLTGPRANRFTHECRLHSDAILTTARTVLADDPRLNVRLDGVETPKPVIVLDRLGRTPVEARLFDAAASVTIYTGSDVPPERLKALSERGALVQPLITGEEGLLPLPAVLSQLGERGVHDLWVEGGGALFSAFLQQRLAQRAYVYISPTLVGEGVSAFARSWENWTEGASLTWVPQGRDVMAEVVW